MQILNSTKKYGLIHLTLHWGMAVLILGMLIAGFIMTKGSKIMYFHKATGVLILALVIFRLLWKLFSKKPQTDREVPKVIARLAKIGSFALYGFMILLPISGISMVLFKGASIDVFGLFAIDAFAKNYNLSKFFEGVHQALVPLFLITLSIHITMACVHHFILKDSTLKKMLP
jgi:cytochrome b561